MTMHLLRWRIDKWRKSTAFTEMDLEQQGAYRNLLDEAALRGGALPNDERILSKACGDIRAWKRIRSAILQRFELREDGTLHHSTLDLTLRQKRSAASRQSRYRSKVTESALPGSAPVPLATAAECPLEEASPTALHARHFARHLGRDMRVTLGVTDRDLPPSSPPHPPNIPPVSLVKNTARPRARGAGSRDGLMAGSFPIDHGECLAHGPVCFKPPVARKYLGRFGNDRSAMVTWAERVCDRWRARVEAGERPPHGDDFAFWAAEYTADFGEAAKPRGEGPRGPGVEETDRYLAQLRSARE